MKKTDTAKVALGGVIAALSIVLMLITGFVPVGTYALPAMAGVLLVAIVIECGAKWAVMVFCAVSLLSLFLAGDKEAAACYIVFFGYYPIVKQRIERIKSKALQIILKLLIFNTAAVAVYFKAIYLLGVPTNEFNIGKYNLPLLLLLAGNVIMIMYDYAMSLLITTYVVKIRCKLFKFFK